MSENKDNGGPAFPVQYSNEADGPTVMPSDGMSLRDYFAVHASAEDLRPHMEVIRESQRKQYGAAILPDNWVSIARYMHADQMLEARK